MTDLDLLNAERDLYRIMDDPYALEKRCVPAPQILQKTLLLTAKIGKDLTIEKLNFQDYKTLFTLMFSINKNTALPDIQSRQIALSPHIPDDLQIEQITEIFRFVIAQNRRGAATLDAEDLKVLCYLHNYLSAKADKAAYLEKFRNWKG